MTSRVIGYLVSLILTLATFFIVLYPDSLTMQMTVIAILILAILQAITQSICFLHIWDEKGIRWNLIFYISTISMILIIIIGSIWIMNHLDYNMMPKHT